MKPASVKWINGLIILRLSIIIIVIILSSIAIINGSDNGFFGGINKAMMERGLYNDGEIAEALGSLIGSNLIPIIFCLVAYIALKKKKKIVFYIFVMLDVFLYLGNGGIPLVSIAILILSFLKTTRDYFEVSESQALSGEKNL